jgi:histidine ammonia-lyase
MMMLEYTAHAAAAELRSLAAPLGPHTAGLSLGVESHASLAPISAARLAEQLPALRVLVAVELVVALRALAVAEWAPRGPRTAELHARASAVLPAGRGDRDFGQDVQIAAGLIEAWLAADRPTSSLSSERRPNLVRGPGSEHS